MQFKSLCLGTLEVHILLFLTVLLKQKLNERDMLFIVYNNDGKLRIHPAVRYLYGFYSGSPTTDASMFFC